MLTVIQRYINLHLLFTLLFWVKLTNQANWLRRCHWTVIYIFPNRSTNKLCISFVKGTKRQEWTLSLLAMNKRKGPCRTRVKWMMMLRLCFDYMCLAWHPVHQLQEGFYYSWTPSKMSKNTIIQRRHNRSDYGGTRHHKFVDWTNVQTCSMFTGVWIRYSISFPLWYMSQTASRYLYHC